MPSAGATSPARVSHDNAFAVTRNRKRIEFPHIFRQRYRANAILSFAVCLVSLSGMLDLANATRRHVPGYGRSWPDYDDSPLENGGGGPLLRAFDNALPDELLSSLRSEGDKLGQWNARYWFNNSTTKGIPPDYWYDLHDPPRIRSEEAIQHLAEVVFPTPPGSPVRGWERAGIVGAEWWVMITEPTHGLGMHHDKDECVFESHIPYCMRRWKDGEGPHKKKGGGSDRENYDVEWRNPRWGSILYVNDFGAPTMILKSNVSSSVRLEREHIPGSWLTFPSKNKYIVFRGDLEHGVVPALTPGAEDDDLVVHLTRKLNRANKQNRMEKRKGHPSFQSRFTFLVNYWSESPLLARATFPVPLPPPLDLPLKEPLGLPIRPGRDSIALPWVRLDVPPYASRSFSAAAESSSLTSDCEVHAHVAAADSTTEYLAHTIVHGRNTDFNFLRLLRFDMPRNILTPGQKSKHANFDITWQRNNYAHPGGGGFSSAAEHYFLPIRLHPKARADIVDGVSDFVAEVERGLPMLVVFEGSDKQLGGRQGSRLGEPQKWPVLEMFFDLVREMYGKLNQTRVVRVALCHKAEVPALQKLLQRRYKRKDIFLDLAPSQKGLRAYVFWRGLDGEERVFDVGNQVKRQLRAINDAPRRNSRQLQQILQTAKLTIRSHLHERTSWLKEEPIVKITAPGGRSNKKVEFEVDAEDEEWFHLL